MKNYDDAISRCKKLAGKVFEPKDDSTNEAVLNWAKEKGMEETWIGIDDKTNDGTHVYSSDNEPVGFTNWDENEPKVVIPSGSGSSFRFCVKSSMETVVSVLSSKKWRSWPCDHNLTFICEKGK